MKVVRYLELGCCAALVLFLLAGCADSNGTREESVRDRQDKALKDPFSFGPSTEKIDVSGGDLKDYDRNAIKKDADRFWNP